MRPKLLKSFIVVLLCWLIGSTLWWSLQRPDVILQALARLARALPFLPIEVPKEATILGSIAIQFKVFIYWTLPVALFAVLSAVIGYGLMWLKAHRTRDERTARETGSGNYRGLTLTVGVLPEPKGLPRDEIDLGAEDESLARLTERERKLLADVLGTVSAHPSAYAGDGIQIPLLDHTLNIASKALTASRNPGLSAIVAAAYEMGKITAYVKNGDEWTLAKSQDKEAARILAMIDSWYAMPMQERNAVLMAVKYHSTPRFLPEIDGDPQTYKLARELLAVADDSQIVAVVQEKQKTLEATKELTGQELPDVIFDALVRALPALSFQNRGLPKGVAAVAWKTGARVYLLEIKLRETVMGKLPAEVRGALLPNPKERSRLQPFTVELLKALDARGWLVKDINDTKVPTKEAVWNIKAGKLDFKGVIVVDVPAEFMPMLPADDSMYEVAVTGPLFTGGGGGGGGGANGGAGNGGMNLSKNDLLGSVLRPSSAPSADKQADKPPTPPALV